MSHITAAELIELVPGLLAMATVEASPEVRGALIRLANRYAAMAGDRQDPAPATLACALAAGTP
jgi:hypothetical protein